MCCSFISSREAHFFVKSLGDSERIASELATAVVEGDTILLEGNLGVGKSAFARAFVRRRLNQPRLKVTSPTFNLQNTYEEKRTGEKADGITDTISIHHVDLYRLSCAKEADFLNLSKLMSQDICLIEWSVRLEDTCPRRYIKVSIQDTDIVSYAQSLDERQSLAGSKNGQKHALENMPKVDTKSIQAFLSYDNQATAGEKRIISITLDGDAWPERFLMNICANVSSL